MLALSIVVCSPCATCLKFSVLVSRAGDPNKSPQSSMQSMPTVVIDAYTGRLAMRTPYDAVRGYFVEALLVISIIVISRLTFVRNNTYRTSVEVRGRKEA
jgi:hypothetical protein